MEKYISKSALVAEIERINKKVGTPPQENSNGEDWPFKAGEQHVCHEIISIINTLEVKEVDLELITGWFDHIAQIANDRKTLNGVIMEDWAALDEIKCLARNSSEFIQKYYKAQKGE